MGHVQHTEFSFHKVAYPSVTCCTTATPVYSCQKCLADLVKPSVQRINTSRGAGGDLCGGLLPTSATRNNEKEDEEETNICQTKENWLKCMDLC